MCDCVHGEVMLLICCPRGELKSVHPQGVNVGSPVLGSPVPGPRVLGSGTRCHKKNRHPHSNIPRIA